MKKPILQSLFIFMALSCGGPDDGPPTIPTNPIDNGTDNDSNDNDGGNSQTNDFRGVNFEGVSNLDLDAITVTFPDGQSDMNASGEFENKAEEEFVILPALFEKEGEILMGYFPETVGQDKVELDDILFYYFKTYPEIAFRRLDDSFLLSSISNSSRYGSLIDKIAVSLNSNLSPIEDAEFEQMVREEALSIIENLENSQAGKEIVGEFKFEYQRDGTILIPRKAPLFAALGVQIKNTQTNQVVYGPSILETQGIILSPNSLADWLIKEFLFEPDPLNTEFKLPNDGTYEIGFTNGNTALDETTSEVNTQNRKYFAVTILSYIVPLGLEKMLTDVQCKESVQTLLDEAQQLVLNLTAGDDSGNAVLLIDFMKNSAKALVDAKKCYLGERNSTEDFAAKLIGELTKRLSVAEDIAELLFFTRDFYLSDIGNTELRKFYDGIAFSELEWTHTSEPNFSLGAGEDAKYEGFVFEKFLSYDVDRGIVSEFIRKEDFKEAEGLPFVADLIEGDASLTSSSIFNTDSFGNVDFSFAMGEQNSKIEFKPDFQESNLESYEVNLEKKEQNNEIIDLLLSKTRWSPSITVRLNQSCSDGTTDQTALNFTNGIFFKEDSSFSWESSYFESQQTGTFSVQGDILTMNGSEAGIIDPQNNEQSNLSFTFVFRYNQDTGVFEGISATYNESGPVLGNTCTWSGEWNGDDSMALF